MPVDLPEYADLVHVAVGSYWNVRQNQAQKSRAQGVVERPPRPCRRVPEDTNVLVRCGRRAGVVDWRLLTAGCGRFVTTP